MGLQIDLPDVNVWVALTSKEHSLHELASEYWQEKASRRVTFCSATSMGFLRVLTNPHALDSKPLTVEEAWFAYASWRADKAVTLAREPKGYESFLQRFVVDSRLTSRLWTDAYLAAFAMSGRMRMVTFDRDFSRFDGLDVLLLG